MLNLLWNKRNQRKKDNKGFSLVELIVVIAIMAILAVVLTPRMTQYLEKAKVSSDKEIASTVYRAVTLAITDEKAYNAAKAVEGGYELIGDGKLYEEVEGENGVYELASAVADADPFLKEISSIVGNELKFKSDAALEGVSIQVTVTSTSEYDVVVEFNGTPVEYK